MKDTMPWAQFEFTATYDKQVVSVKIPGDSALSDAIDALEVFLIAAGFDPTQVRESFS